MNKFLISPNLLLFVAISLFIGCASGGGRTSKTTEDSYSVQNNHIIDGANLIDRAYRIIFKEYYRRVSGSTMLYESVKGIEHLVGDTGCIIIEDGYPKILNPHTQKLLEQNLTQEEGLQTLKEIYRFTIKNKPEYNGISVAHAALDGFLQSLDPQSTKLPAEAFDDFNKDSERKNTGIGINMQMKDGFVTVISAIDNTPAMRSGIRADDRIISIDGKPVINLWQAVKFLRGQEGTQVLVSIIRPGQKEQIDLELIRTILPNDSVKAVPITPGYGYIRVSRFQGTTDKELKTALNTLGSGELPLQGVIIDLRNNPGGLLNQAIKVSDIFIEEGIIVQIKGSIPKNTKIFMSTPKLIKNPVLMAILINEGSAAATEIFAGALQDHKLAIILGTKSNSRGSVQAIESLPDGTGLKLTIAVCSTPSGRSIEDEGIEPDIVIERNFYSENNYFYYDNTLFIENGASKLSAIERKLEDDNQVKRALEILIQKNQLKLDV
jgi:C-terminal peptidase prc